MRWKIWAPEILMFLKMPRINILKTEETFHREIVTNSVFVAPHKTQIAYERERVNIMENKCAPKMHCWTTTTDLLARQRGEHSSEYDFNTMTLSLNLIRNITHFKVCNTKNLNRFMFLSILTSSLFMKQLIIEFIVFIVWNRFVSWFFGIYSLFELNWIRSINKIIFNLFISFMYWESIKISSKRYHFDVKKRLSRYQKRKKRRRHL